jgi:PTH1 family peptidyl-tRNA hydrolase
VIAHLGDAFPRLRIGVGRGEQRRDLADHVLSKFEKDESAEVERMTARAADAAEMFITSGIEAVMNAFNGGDPATTEKPLRPSAAPNHEFVNGRVGELVNTPIP